MNKLSKVGFIITSLVFLTPLSSLAITEENHLSCPLEPQENRTIVLFNSNSLIVAHESLAEALAGPIDVSLSAGIYNITATSFDDHTSRDPLQNQPKEQFYFRLSNGQTTNRISDLPEDVNWLTELIDGGFSITSAITTITAQHTEFFTAEKPNSITPVCVAFDNVTPDPSPTPSPSPTPDPTLSPSPTPLTGQGGPGDETDCCPGLDPEPTTTPKVAGIQTKISPPATPAVAGTLTTFPSSGLSLKAITWFILPLLTFLLI